MIPWAEMDRVHNQGALDWAKADRASSLRWLSAISACKMRI